MGWVDDGCERNWSKCGEDVAGALGHECVTVDAFLHESQLMIQRISAALLTSKRGVSAWGFKATNIGSLDRDNHN
jgi:hypothetical protein